MIAAVTVDFDKSVLLQMALFSVLIVVLKPLLFDPMLRMFALREEKTDGAKAEARSMQERAADILSSYEKELERVRADASEERDRLRKETARAEAEILAEARAATDAIVHEGRARIELESASFKRDLEEMGQRLSGELGQRVLGRELSA